MTGQLVVRISCAVSYALRCRTVESVAHWKRTVLSYSFY